MSEEVKLLLCPFCGGEARLHFSTIGTGWWQALCIQCRVESYSHREKNVVAQLWNRRTPDPEPDWEQIFSEPSPFLMTMQEDGKLMEMVKKALGKGRGDDKSDKPCPFCGSEKFGMSGLFDGDRGVCEDCLAMGPRTNSGTRAEELWNRRTPEPGTSVVRWVRYDGTEKTLPELDKPVLLSARGHDCEIFTLTISYNKPVWDNDRGCSDPIIDDLWAYLPEPPEGMG